MRTTLLTLSAAAACWTIAAQPAHARSDLLDLAFASPITAPLPAHAGTTNPTANNTAEQRGTQAARRAPRERRPDGEPQAERPAAAAAPNPLRVLPCPPDDFSRACRRGGSGPEAIPDSALMRQRQIL